jgi:hypothetical protein
VRACVFVPLSILQSLVKKLERILFCFCLLNQVVVVYVTCSSAYIPYTMRERRLLWFHSDGFEDSVGVVQFSFGNW